MHGIDGFNRWVKSIPESATDSDIDNWCHHTCRILERFGFTPVVETTDADLDWDDDDE